MIRVERWKGGRNWAVYDEAGELVTVCVYKRGAVALASLLTQACVLLRELEALRAQ